MAKARNINKHLAGMEDLLQGKGQVVQTRNGKEYSVGRVDVPYAVSAIEEMQALPVNLFSSARVYTGLDTYSDYVYDPDDNSGISSDIGDGSWFKVLISDYYTQAQVDALVQTVADSVAAETAARITQKRKNYIVNPSMAISQENGYDTGVVPAGVDYYLADQFFSAVVTAAGATMERSFGTINGFRSVVLTATSASTDLTGSNFNGRIATRLEGANVANLNGRDVCLSFKVATNWAGNLAVSIINGAGGRSYVVDVAVEAGENSVTIPFALEAGSVPSPDNSTGLRIDIGFCNEGSFRGNSANNETWQAGDFFCSEQSTQWTKTSGNYIEVTAVKLEEGTVPSAFEPNSYAYDLAECQRYYCKGVFNVRGVALGEGRFQSRIALPVALRSQSEAVVTLSNTSTSGGFNSANPTLTASGGDQAALFLSTNFLTPTTIDSSLEFDFTANARL